MAGRNIKQTVLLLLVVLSATLLPAVEPVRIGFVGIDQTRTSQNHLERIFSFVSSQDTTPSTYTSYGTLVEERLARSRDLAELAKQHLAIEEADGDSLALQPEDPSSDTESSSGMDSSIFVEWLHIEVPQSLGDALADQDTTVADYVMKLHGIDLLMVGVIEPFEPLVRIRIGGYRSGGDYGAVYEDIVVPSDLGRLVPDAIVAILSSFDRSPIGLLRIDGIAPGLAVSIDGKPKEDVRDSFMVLEEGERELIFSAPGFESVYQTMTIESGSVQDLTLSLDRIEGPPVLITSDSGMTGITIPHVLDKQVPVLWESQRTPFVIYAQEDGRRMATLQYAEAVDEVNISLQPLWQDPVYGTARAQDAMYASLGRTMLLGGLTIILDSVSRSVASYTDDLQMWQPIILGATGALTVSLFDTGARLFAYYQKTKYSSR